MPDHNQQTQKFLIVRRAAVAVLAMTLLVAGTSPSSYAAPGQSSAAISARAQNVDWMSPDTAMSLDLPMDVMVPTWVPDPFNGMAPSVTASGGYYQLYWMISGGAPTFLYIEGTVGGALPAGSPADLNKPLSINSSVQGWDAIHDIGMPAGSDTLIYDQVWWIANGVLYTVSSNNMTGADSLSLANSLVALQAPAPPVEVPVEPTEPPYIPPTEPAPIEEAPEVDAPVVEDVPEVSTDSPPVAESTVPDASDPGVVTDSPTEASGPSSTESGSGDDVGGTGADVTEGDVTGSEASGPWSPGRYDQNVPSDGTGGPLPPVIGGDGTGGPNDLSLPTIVFRP